jgi:hypothetical protein
MIKKDAEGVEKLNGAVEAAKNAQIVLQDTLAQAETLKEQIGAGVNEGFEGREELMNLIAQLQTLESLNQFELENYNASITKFANKKIVIDSEETTVGALANDYIQAYQIALREHIETLDELASQINDLEMMEDSKTKDALDNAKDAFEKAKAYEAGCLEACDEVNKIISAINGVQGAQDKLDEIQNDKYEKIFDTFDGEGGLQEKAQAAYEAMKNAPSDLIKQGNYYKAMDAIARERIVYLLMKEGVVKDPGDIEYTAEKHGIIEEKNYFEVTYPVYNEEGEIIGIQKDCSSSGSEYSHSRSTTYRTGCRDGTDVLVVAADHRSAWSNRRRDVQKTSKETARASKY